VIAVFVVILFVLQRSDLERSQAATPRPCSERSPKAVARSRTRRRWRSSSCGPEGIVVARKGGAQADWLCDLWLAERLAESA
jgi:hypothetical protein